jgi:hypothetical protein
MNKADTCPTYVLPQLTFAGWEDQYVAAQSTLPSVFEPQRREFKGEL